MRKAIMRLVWYEVWDNFKKNLLAICIVLAILIGGLCMDSKMEYNSSVDFVIHLGIWIVIFRIQPMPLRICKGAYVCPLDEQWRLFYLRLKIGVKMVYTMLFLLIILYSLASFDLLGNNILLYAVYLMMMFFTALYFSIHLGKNEEGAVKIDENGYRIRSKAEEMMKTNFMIMLIMEWMLFAVSVLGVFGMNGTIGGIVWLVCLLVNVIFVHKYLRLYLLENIVYERVYSYKPKEESVQYDI